MATLRSAGVVGSALIFLTVLTIGPAGQEQHQPRFRAGVELVTVDVTVLNRQGEPLVGLFPQDFTVTADGAERQIVAWRHVRAGAERPAAAAASAPVEPV
jgi:hypothetical protein